MAIPGLLGTQVAKIIQHRKQAGNEQHTSSDNGNVQILEHLRRECKKPVDRSSAGRGRKLQLRTDQEEKERASRKWREFLNVAWGIFTVKSMR